MDTHVMIAFPLKAASFPKILYKMLLPTFETQPFLFRNSFQLWTSVTMSQWPGQCGFEQYKHFGFTLFLGPLF